MIDGTRPIIVGGLSMILHDQLIYWTKCHRANNLRGKYLWTNKKLTCYHKAVG